jgi:hypothetical protein
MCQTEQQGMMVYKKTLVEKQMEISILTIETVRMKVADVQIENLLVLRLLLA